MSDTIGIVPLNYLNKATGNSVSKGNLWKVNNKVSACWKDLRTPSISSEQGGCTFGELSSIIDGQAGEILRYPRYLSRSVFNKAPFTMQYNYVVPIADFPPAPSALPSAPSTPSPPASAASVSNGVFIDIDELRHLK